MNMKLLMPILLVGIMVSAGIMLITDSEGSDGAVVASGTCGDNLNWEYDDVTTTLTISGSGTTMNSYSTSPWRAYSANITNVLFNTPNLKNIGTYAFSNCSKLTIIELPSGITIINYNAFYGCTNLELIRLPNGLLTISSNVFSNCTNLALTSLPNSITRIDAEAFSNCTKLALTSLPNGITSIGNRAFYKCTNLALTDLPNNLTSIGYEAFDSCINIALTTLPSGITSIGYEAFDSCTNLALTKLPSGLTTINMATFRQCTQLALTELPAGLTSIGSNAFYGCSNLALTELPNNLTSIDSSAFGNCTKLSSIIIPPSVTSIEKKAFSSCTNLQHIEYNAINVTSTWTSGNFPFTGCTKIQEVTIGENVQRLPNYLFYENSAVTSWTIINWNATNCADLSYDNMVFHNDKIHTIIFGDNVKHIPAYLTREFADTLESVSFNEGLESIGDSAFANATNMVALSLPDSVQSLGTWAFMGCSELRLTTLPSNLATVGANAFSGCTRITDLTIYQSTKFSGDSGLRLNSVILKPSENASAYDTPEGNPWTISQDIIQTVTLDGITHLYANTFAGMDNVYEVLAVDVPNQLGWYKAPNAQSSELADLVAGDEAWLMSYSSAEADIGYDSPIINLDNVEGTIVVNGTDVPLEPDMMVYPSTYPESGNTTLGAMIKFIPIVVILSVFGALAMMVRGKRFEL